MSETHDVFLVLTHMTRVRSQCHTGFIIIILSQCDCYYHYYYFSVNRYEV